MHHHLPLLVASLALLVVGVTGLVVNGVALWRLRDDETD